MTSLQQAALSYQLITARSFGMLCSTVAYAIGRKQVRTRLLHHVPHRCVGVQSNMCPIRDVMVTASSVASRMCLFIDLLPYEQHAVSPGSGHVICLLAAVSCILYPAKHCVIHL